MGALEKASEDGLADGHHVLAVLVAINIYDTLWIVAAGVVSGLNGGFKVGAVGPKTLKPTP